jgi:hypothetical protein
LSGFKNLKTLEILDMDTLEYISEIRECVKNSSATMNTLKLSFSEALACKSRKPLPETPSDSDSDQDDGFPSMPPPGFPSMMPPPGPPPPPAFKTSQGTGRKEETGSCAWKNFWSRVS